MILRKKTVLIWRWVAFIMLSIFLLLSTLMSCNIDEQDSRYETAVPVQFLSELLSPQGNLGGVPRSPASRASNDSWDKDDRVGIYMTPHDADGDGTQAIDVANAIKENVPYKASESGTSSALVPVDASIFFPQDGSPVNFMAYYPYNSVVHSTHSHIYPVNVATQDPLTEIDLLYHSSTTAYTADDSQNGVSLVFSHQLSKLNISVVAASGISADFSTATASLAGVPTTASFDLATGVLSNADGTGTAIVPVKDETLSSSDLALFESIFVPHDGAGDDGSGTATNRVITLNIDGTDYSYIVPEERSFLSGTAYSYSFKFTGNGLVLTQATVVDWDAGIIFWGERQLTTTKTYFDLPYTASVADVAQDINTVTFSTTAPTAPAFLLSNESGSVTTDTPDWITNVTLTSTGEVDGWNSYTLTFDTDIHIGSVSRTGYIHVVIEGLTLAVRVTQDYLWEAPIDVHDGLSNCYMVVPGNSVQFPATRAFTIGGAVGAKAENLSVKVLWDDTGVISGTPTFPTKTEDGTITVTTTADQSGNAVVALYDTSDDTIYWSWHIWVTTYLPGTATWHNNGFMFMDRNLGATEAANSLAGRGLFYQWGRKDPFPGGKTGIAGFSELSKFSGMPNTGDATITTVGATTVGTGIVEAIRNPTTFYVEYNTGIYNWLPMTENALWNTADGKKAVYDPCPTGWRVPCYRNGTSPWDNITNTKYPGGDNSGANFGINALYPAANLRNRDNGAVTTWGNPGYYWIATAYSFYGYCLNFNDDGTKYNTSYSRAAGMSVRCVHESLYVTNPIPASFTDVVADGTTGNTFTFETNSTATPTITTNKGAMITGLTSASTSSNGVYTWTVTFNVTENMESNELEGTITIDIEGIIKTVSVSQVAGVPPPVVDQPNDGMTNCYIVNINSSVSFGVSRAYAYDGTAFTTTLHVGREYTGEFVCKTIWDDSSVLSSATHTVVGNGNGTTVTINTSDNEGNAVVGLYKSDDTTTPVWSYHIWVLADYDPSDATWTHNDYTFMDRNLGATEAANSLAGRGLFYQWGRKDPFPGGKAGMAGYSELDKFTGLTNGSPSFFHRMSATTLAGGLVQGIRNPAFFYSQYGDTYYDWLPENDNALWNTSSGQKSIYDPCPSGWRVPAYKGSTSDDANSPWYGIPQLGDAWALGADDGGTNWGTNALYPAAGFRDSGGGAFDDGGNRGYYWSASVNGKYGSRLYFTYKGVTNTNSGNPRSQGYTIRCVQE